jgi:hypothetical protein
VTQRIIHKRLTVEQAVGASREPPCPAPRAHHPDLRHELRLAVEALALDAAVQVEEFGTQTV